MSEELKPCPFCGNKYAGEIEHGDTLIGFYHIACAKCEAQIVGGTLEAAKQLWNKRSKEDQLKTQLAEHEKVEAIYEAHTLNAISDADKFEAKLVVLREALGKIIEEEITDCYSDDWCPCADIARTALTNTSDSTAKIQAVLDATEEQERIHEKVVHRFACPITAHHPCTCIPKKAPCLCAVCRAVRSWKDNCNV